ncbi:hypothetical protein DQ783_11385 [Salmonella enterica subsp. enterica serovar Newport]|uniref:DUF2158 domain-containing protein n=3 Tax=Salmonella enterica TaxID=28901 RepID=A0A5X8Y344_SALNE|nr:hypothetical protein LFZ16_00655 [Salmonella enterica subsp. enterica serovar India str. SA20085604]EAW2934202.1 DUF2158 domain-containing protein [Salmonella enterica]EBR7993965.1 hypothetical protein [Salmonella enterica subsp. enterica serovar Panama]EBV0461875.1 hypothetical protein [Salmonella enterica subsp. enterica serovar Newport]EBR8434519.1 hypothetical protein [Salmonella enterica subsp. enterica serovar Panama]
MPEDGENQTKFNAGVLVMTFKSGDVVTLKSGGEVMTVIRTAGEVDEFGLELRAGCVETRWIRNGQPGRGIFEVVALEYAEAQEGK